jgi:hypothetical protein
MISGKRDDGIDWKLKIEEKTATTFTTEPLLTLRDNNRLFHQSWI